MVDGAGIPAMFRRGCRHSVQWYARSLANTYGALLQDDSRTMTDALADAIRHVTGLHDRDCTLDQGSPSATVAAWRMDGDEVEYLVLCDASIVLVFPDGGAREITDNRIEDAARRVTAELDQSLPADERRLRRGEAMEHLLREGKQHDDATVVVWSG